MNELHKYYWDNGYLVIPNLFTEAQIDTFYWEFTKCANTDWTNILNPHKLEFLVAQNPYPLTRGDLTMVDKIGYINDCKRAARLANFIFHSTKIITYLENLYDSEMEGLSTHLIWKHPHTKAALQSWEPHQDNSYAQNPNGKLVTINLFLNPSNPIRGGLYNYPGSHTEGLLPVDCDNSYINNNKPGKRCEVPEKYYKNDLSTSKGDLYIQHGNLIHGSYG